MGSKTQDIYTAAWATLVKTVGTGLATATGDVIDRALGKVIFNEYLDGASLAECRVLYYATLWQTGLGNGDLKRSYAALQGFRSCTRERIGLPNSWEATLLLAHEGLQRGDPQEILTAAALLLQFDLMARLGEMCVLDASWIFSVRHRFSASTALVVFFLWDSSGRDKSKQQDDAVGVGELTKHFWLCDLLRALARRSPTGSLLQLTLCEYETIFKRLAHRSGLSGLKMVPHGHRHGGASYMALSIKKFDAQAIQTRGRWRAATSVMRSITEACRYSMECLTALPSRR